MLHITGKSDSQGYLMQVNWIVAIFVSLTDSSSHLRQILWRWVYNKIASRDVSGKFVFMNYGYNDDKEEHFQLNNQDESSRYYIQLYNHIIKDIDLCDKNIIEVGCGRGGGGSFLLRYKNPLSYTGIDLSAAAIEWCKRQYQFTNAHWVQGLANALPVNDNSVDVVLNVESSHCYPSMNGFLREVKRVLRASGYMAFCDIRRSSGIETLDNNINASGLRVLKRYEITSKVLNALDQISPTRDSQITSVFPPIFQKAVRDFAAVKDTAVYNMLKNGQMQYLCYLLQKP
jgi:ubiquinone/menaquinone biosynthesis C-methylase UbiE